MARKIIHLSLGACLGSMPGMRMNYNRTGILAHPQTFESWFLKPHKSKLTRKSSKVAWCHVMAHICRGKNNVQFGPSFITNLLQTGASLKEASWF